MDRKILKIERDILDKMIITISSLLAIAGLRNFFHFDKSALFYSSIASVVVTNIDFIKLKRNSYERVVGTIVGGIFGVVASYLNYSLLITILISEILIILITEKLLKVSSNIASIVFLAIFIGISSKSDMDYITSRIYATIVGVLITILVGYIFSKVKEKSSK